MPQRNIFVFSIIWTAIIISLSTLFFLTISFYIYYSIVLIPVAAMYVYPTVYIFWTA